MGKISDIIVRLGYLDTPMIFSGARGRGGQGASSEVVVQGRTSLVAMATSHHSVRLTNQVLRFSNCLNLMPAETLQQVRDADMRFSYLAGVVDAENRSRLERQLFRTTRGNCYVRFAEIREPIRDPVTGESIMKLVFIVFFKVR